jgi:outer membrane protein assembly factor BamB
VGQKIKKVWELSPADRLNPKYGRFQNAYHGVFALNDLICGIIESRKTLHDNEIRAYRKRGKGSAEVWRYIASFTEAKETKSPESIRHLALVPRREGGIASLVFQVSRGPSSKIVCIDAANGKLRWSLRCEQHASQIATDADYIYVLPTQAWEMEKHGEVVSHDFASEILVLRAYDGGEATSVKLSKSVGAMLAPGDPTGRLILGMEREVQEIDTGTLRTLWKARLPVREKQMVDWLSISGDSVYGDLSDINTLFRLQVFNNGKTHLVWLITYPVALRKGEESGDFAALPFHDKQDKRFYLPSTAGLMRGIDCERGKTLWTAKVKDEGCVGIGSPCRVGNQLFAAFAAENLYLLNPKTGKVLDRLEWPHPLEVPLLPAPNDEGVLMSLGKSIAIFRGNTARGNASRSPRPLIRRKSYVERYCNGECEAVYSELIALGGAVRKEPLFSEAKAVAEETVRRSRHNLLLLHERLLKLGFEFGASEKALRMAGPDAARKLNKIEKKMGTLPILLRTWYLTFDNVQFWQPKKHVLRIKRGGSPPQGSDVWGLARHSVLMFASLDECLDMRQQILDEHDEIERQRGDEPPFFPQYPRPTNFLPLGTHASNEDAKGFRLPCDGIDGAYYNEGFGDEYFNMELRRAFEWGGFPYWSKLLKSPKYRSGFWYVPDFPRLLPILKEGLLKV